MYPLENERVRGLILGNLGDPVRSGFLDYFTKADFDMDWEGPDHEIFETVYRLPYDFILYFDSVESGTDPNFLSLLEQKISGKKVIVFFESGGMNRYLEIPRSNIFGYLSVSSKVEIVHFLVQELLANLHSSMSSNEAINERILGMELVYN